MITRLFLSHDRHITDDAIWTLMFNFNEQEKIISFLKLNMNLNLAYLVMRWNEFKKYSMQAEFGSCISLYISMMGILLAPQFLQSALISFGKIANTPSSLL